MHWHHPEWVALAVAQAGWLLALAALVNDPSLMVRGTMVHSWSGLVFGSMVMSFAMMTPLVIDRVHDVAVSSLWARRYRAEICYLAGYLVPWVMVGTVMMLVSGVLTMTVGPLVAVAAAAVGAVVVASTTGHRRRLVRCYATRPFAVTGWRADRDCLVDGSRMAGRCIATSWALMAVVMVQGGLLVMIVGTAVLFGERRRFVDRRSAFWWTVALCVLAVLLSSGLGLDGHGVGVTPGSHHGH
ncbi:copper chaperone [Gordonia sp. NPDC003424]